MVMVVLVIVFIYKYEKLQFDNALEEKIKSDEINVNESAEPKVDTYIKYDAIYSSLLNDLYNKYKKCSYSLRECMYEIERRKKIYRRNNATEIKYLLPFPININNVIESTRKCRENMELIIGINTVPDSFLERYTFRKIYNEYDNVDYYFFIAMSLNETVNELIKEENKKYNDIIQFDFVSHYYNLTYQTIGCLRWLNKHCKNYKYIVEHQSDTFFNIIYYNHKYGRMNKTYEVISSIYRHRGPIRETKNLFYKRWEVPKYIYPYNLYPDYPQGPCILFSEDAINKICESSYSYNFVLFLDDVYLGLLMNKTGIKQHSAGNAIRNAVGNVLNVNKIKTNILWLHGIKPGLMYYIWKAIK